MELDQLGRLRDILQAAQLIASYVKDTNEPALFPVVTLAPSDGERAG